jgi:hypothetical protein
MPALTSMPALKRGLRLLIGLALALAGCSHRGNPAGTGPCAGGGSSCAAAAAAPGLRQVLRGHRFVRAHWVERTNKESGVPDIGIQAEWAPTSERH